MRKVIATCILTILCLANADTLSIGNPPQAKTVVETVYVDKRDKVLSFADELYELEDFSRASVEYLRYSYLFSDAKCSDKALFRAAYCKERSAQFEQARVLYMQLGTMPDARSQSFSAYRLPLTYFIEDKLDSALMELDTTTTPLEVHGALDYLRGWIFLKQRRYNESSLVFKQIGEHSQESDISGSISYLQHRCEQANDISHRSPFFAGAFSAIVPGLGRGYCGRWGDAFFSLIVVGAPAGLSAYLWDSDPTFAAVMAGLGGFFYLGNIYGSAKGASIYNEEKEKIFWKTTWNEVPHPPTMLYSEMPCEKE